MGRIQRYVASLLEKPGTTKVFFLIAQFLMLLLGFITGTIHAELASHYSTPIEIIPNLHTPQPVVTLLGKQGNDILLLSQFAPLRIIQEEGLFVAPKDTPFRVYIPDVTSESLLPSVTSPCILVASESGKKVYLHGSQGAQKIEKPICFTSLVEAENAGYSFAE